MIQVLDWILWGTGLAFWTLAIGGIVWSAAAALIQTWRRRAP